MLRLIIAAFVLVVVAGGTVFYVTTREENNDDTTPSTEQVKNTESKTQEVYLDPKTDTASQAETRTLTVSYESKILASFPGVTKNSARQLCAITDGSGTCAWGSELVTQSATLAQRVAEKQFTVALRPNEDPLKFGIQYEIDITDPKGAAAEYRIFLIHKDLLARINGVYEARITAETVPRGNARVFEWYLQEKHINESGKEVFDRVPLGHYEIAVVDTVTGRISGLTKRFRIGEDATKTSNTVEYGANTPLANSYWDGRGVFFDGAGGEDTINMVGTMAMYDIFKGLEFPERGHLDTLIFVQAGSVVITVVNVENIGFDDKTLKTTDLMTMLKASGGAIYRTQPFAP